MDHNSHPNQQPKRPQFFLFFEQSDNDSVERLFK